MIKATISSACTNKITHRKCSHEIIVIIHFIPRSFIAILESDMVVFEKNTVDFETIGDFDFWNEEIYFKS